MLASSPTTSTGGRTGAAGRGEGAGPCGGEGIVAGGRAAPRGRWLSSQASMSRLRKRHWRPTRTAGIFPALISRYTVRRLTWRYSRTSSVVRNVSSIMRQRPDRRRSRQFDGEHGAPIGVVGGDDLPAVFLDDAVGDGQSQARAFANFLRRIKRFENARQGALGNPHAGIMHGRDDAVA